MGDSAYPSKLKSGQTRKMNSVTSKVQTTEPVFKEPVSTEPLKKGALFQTERLIDAFLSIFLCSFCFLAFYFQVHSVFQCSDTGWLVKTGEFIWNNHSIPSTDIFSWTCPTRSWTIYQWLFMFCCGGLFKTGGLWLVGVVVAALTATVYLWILPAQMLKYNVRTPFVFGLLFLVSSELWYFARPQIISFLLIPVYLIILERLRTKGYTPLQWLLPLLMLVWANGHSFWFIGLGIAASYLIPEAVRSNDAATRQKLISVLCACVAAVFVNPYGIELLKYNASFLTEPDFQTIWELKPILINDWFERRNVIAYFVFAWIMLIAGRKHVPRRGFIVAAIATVAAFRIYRFVAVAILLTWPYLGMAFNRFAAAKTNYGRFAHITVNTVMPVVAIAFSVFAYNACFPHDKPIWFTHNESNFNVVKMLQRHKELQRNLFVDSAVGCSMILEDMTPVFIDSRFDFYGKKFCDDWIDCLQGKGDWRGYLSSWNISTLCIAKHYPLNNILKESSDWLLVFDDGSGVIWIANDAAGKALYSSLDLSPQSLEYKNLDSSVKRTVLENLCAKKMQLANALMAKGEHQMALKERQEAIAWLPKTK